MEIVKVLVVQLVLELVLEDVIQPVKIPVPLLAKAIAKEAALVNAAQPVLVNVMVVEMDVLEKLVQQHVHKTVRRIADILVLMIVEVMAVAVSVMDIVAEDVKIILLMHQLNKGETI